MLFTPELYPLLGLNLMPFLDVLVNFVFLESFLGSALRFAGPTIVLCLSLLSVSLSISFFKGLSNLCKVPTFRVVQDFDCILKRRF